MAAAPASGEAAYASGQARLREGDLAAALDWFAAAKKEPSALSAGGQRLLIFAARELAYLVLHKDCLDGQGLALVALEKKKENSTFDAVCRDYRNKGQAAAEALLGECRDFAALDRGQALPFSIRPRPSDWPLPRWRELLSKGEMPEAEERGKLEEGMALHNYNNLLAEVLDQPPPGDEAPVAEKEAKRHRFYLICGSRLAIISRGLAGEAKRRLFADAALAALNKVLQMVPEQGVDPDRLRAEEEKRALQEMAAPAPARLCPKCHQAMEQSWRFCPYDGAPLAAAKK